MSATNFLMSSGCEMSKLSSVFLDSTTIDGGAAGAGNFVPPGSAGLVGGDAPGGWGDAAGGAGILVGGGGILIGGGGMEAPGGGSLVGGVCGRAVGVGATGASSGFGATVAGA